MNAFQVTTLGLVFANGVLIGFLISNYLMRDRDLDDDFDPATED